MRSPLAVLALAAALLPPPADAAERPPLGKYRCYEPPDQIVFAWFEITPDGVGINGDPPRRFAFDAKARRIDWPGDDLDPYRHGIFFPRGTMDEHAERTTIVLTPRRSMRPGQSGWDTYPRCYLTTH